MRTHTHTRTQTFLLVPQDHAHAVQGHEAVAAELAHCQQQLSEVAASSASSKATSEIYTRVGA